MIVLHLKVVMYIINNRCSNKIRDRDDMFVEIISVKNKDNIVLYLWLKTYHIGVERFVSGSIRRDN